MGENILDVRIQQRYDTEENWEAVNPILLEGECAYSKDKNNQYKQGDGTHHWTELAYATSPKLSTARTITFTDDVTGSFSFDGSSDISIPLKMSSSLKIDRVINGPVIGQEDFVDLVATIENELFTPNCVADVYFSESSIPIAKKANITVETGNGYLKLKAKKLPIGSLMIETIRIFYKEITSTLNGDLSLDGTETLEGYTNTPLIIE